VSEDGTRLYSAQVAYGLGPPMAAQAARRPSPGNGLVIVDVSDYQSRKANPQPKILGQLLWRDAAIAQESDPFLSNGRRFLLFTDEYGSGGSGGPKAACAQGLPPHAFARIIDISDETNPKLASQLKLEVDDPANCATVLTDSHGAGVGYSSHYCTLDNPAEARYAACTYFEAGLRVFDIRDPYRPKEIAYYKPPARQGPIPGSYHAVRPADKRTTDWTASNVRWLRRGNQTELWFTSMDNGFHIVRFTNALASIGTTMAGRDPVRDPR
jgi:LVIVD repeat